MIDPSRTFSAAARLTGNEKSAVYIHIHDCLRNRRRGGIKQKKVARARLRRTLEKEGRAFHPLLNSLQTRERRRGFLSARRKKREKRPRDDEREGESDGIDR